MTVPGLGPPRGRQPDGVRPLRGDPNTRLLRGLLWHTLPTAQTRYVFVVNLTVPSNENKLKTSKKTISSFIHLSIGINKHMCTNLAILVLKHSMPLDFIFNIII